VNHVVGRLSIRARLTIVFGLLLLAAGSVMLGLTYLLLSQRLPGIAVRVEGSGPGAGGIAGPGLSSPELQRMVASRGDALQSATLRELFLQGGIALAVVSVVGVALGWLIAGQVLSPLSEITAAARRIARAGAAGGLHERIGLHRSRGEVRELADTFDTMLERLDRSFDSQRRFVANASHELRTPLTINRALLELAERQGEPTPELRQLTGTLLAVNERHERLIDGLLTLADSENPVTDRTPVDLCEVVRHVVAGTDAESVHLTTGLEPAPTTGDPVLIERAVANLVANAVRHNRPEGGWATVSTGVDGPWATVTVSNSGAVIPGYDVPGLFEPFRRLDADRTRSKGGVGLGLSIVRAVAQAHGGRVVARTRDEGGLEVSVQLPSSAR
jgi:signal transduction histidine kinase